MSKKAYARTITKDMIEQQGDEDKPSKMHIADKRNALKSIADKIASSVFYYRNWYYPGGAEAFSNVDMRCVEKYYPQAVGGALLVDEPQYDDEIRECEEKALFLRKNGFRYIIVKPKATLEECLVQLGG